MQSVCSSCHGISHQEKQNERQGTLRISGHFVPRQLGIVWHHRKLWIMSRSASSACYHYRHFLTNWLSGKLRLNSNSVDKTLSPKACNHTLHSVQLVQQRDCVVPKITQQDAFLCVHNPAKQMNLFSIFRTQSMRVVDFLLF